MAAVAHSLKPAVVIVAGTRHNLLLIHVRRDLAITPVVFRGEGLDWSTTLRTCFASGGGTTGIHLPPLLTASALLLLVGRRAITLARTGTNCVVLAWFEQLDLVVAVVLMGLDSRLLRVLVGDVVSTGAAAALVLRRRNPPVKRVPVRSRRRLRRSTQRRRIPILSSSRLAYG